MVNGVGGVTRFGYDELGRCIKVTHPSGASTATTYTALGQPETFTDQLGQVTTHHYDPAGRPLSVTSADGDVVETVYQDQGRVVGEKAGGKWRWKTFRDAEGARWVEDFTHPDQLQVLHRLENNRLGQLTSRTTSIRDGAETTSTTTRWQYDACGRRVGLVTPEGHQARYDRDMVGRVVRLSHSVFGDWEFDYDAAGNMVQAQAGEYTYRWEYTGGLVTAHTVTGPDQSRRYQIHRDTTGRVQSITDPSGMSRYSYDAAGQLIGAETPHGPQGWEYDLDGRLVKESTPEDTRTFMYDLAGQLLSVDAGAVGRTVFEYDAAGRRIKQESHGWVQELVWDPAGWLRTIITTSTTDEQCSSDSSLCLWVDALGDLVQVDGVSLVWDVGQPSPELIQAGQDPVLVGPGGVSGVAGQIQARWRAGRGMDADRVWDPVAFSHPVGQSPGLGVTGEGGLVLAGFEWLGARVYDPGMRGFVSRDPLPSVVGSGWSGHGYAYAGNDPVHAVDPWGLSPISDEEFAEYGAQKANPWGTKLKEIGSNIRDNPLAFAGGAILLAAGVAAMFVPGGFLLSGVIAGAAISGGVNLVEQAATPGKFSWGELGKELLFGGLAGGVGKAVSSGLRHTLFKGPAKTMKSTRDLVANPQVQPRKKMGAIKDVLDGRSATQQSARAQRIAQGHDGNALKYHSVDVASGVGGDLAGANTEYMARVVAGDQQFDSRTLLAQNVSQVTVGTVTQTMATGVRADAPGMWSNDPLPDSASYRQHMTAGAIDAVTGAPGKVATSVVEDGIIQQLDDQ